MWFNQDDRSGFSFTVRGERVFPLLSAEREFTQISWSVNNYYLLYKFIQFMARSTSICARDKPLLTWPLLIYPWSCTWYRIYYTFRERFYFHSVVFYSLEGVEFCICSAFVWMGYCPKQLAWVCRSPSCLCITMGLVWIEMLSPANTGAAWSGWLGTTNTIHHMAFSLDATELAFELHAGRSGFVGAHGRFIAGQKWRGKGF